jgi:hypothetical protein
MPWTTPTDRTAGYVVTATDWNAGGQDDLSFLYGDTGWTTVTTFTNSWTASPPAQYILIGRVVYLRGSITGGTAGTSAFTLPAAYRPTSAVNFTCVTGTAGTPNTVTVGTTGNVVPTTSTNTGLSNISFPIV